MATHSSILAWRIPWTEELSGLQPMGSQRVRQDLGIKHSTAAHSLVCLFISFIYFNDLVIYSLSAFVLLDVFHFLFFGMGVRWALRKRLCKEITVTVIVSGLHCTAWLRMCEHISLTLFWRHQSLATMLTWHVASFSSLSSLEVLPWLG